VRTHMAGDAVGAKDDIDRQARSSVRDTSIEEYARAQSGYTTRVTTVHIGVVEVL
jgi:hypothetical protein